MLQSQTSHFNELRRLFRRPMDEGQLNRATLSERGFVLVLVLIALALLSVIAVEVSVQSRTSVDAVYQLRQDAQIRAEMDAAVNYALSRMKNENELVSGSWEPWAFDGKTVKISIEYESAKADVNYSDFELAAAFIKGADLPPTIEADVLRALAAARQSNSIISSVSALLSPCQRLTAALPRLETVLTVFTRASGVDPEHLSRQQIDWVPGARPLDEAAIFETKRLTALP